MKFFNTFIYFWNNKKRATCSEVNKFNELPFVNLDSSPIRIQLVLKSLTNLVTNIYIQRAFELEESLVNILTQIVTYIEYTITNNSIDIAYSSSSSSSGLFELKNIFYTKSFQTMEVTTNSMN